VVNVLVGKQDALEVLGVPLNPSDELPPSRGEGSVYKIPVIRVVDQIGSTPYGVIPTLDNLEGHDTLNHLYA